MDRDALDRLKEFRPELYVIFERAAAIQLDKAADYADTDSYRNLRDCEEMGIPAWKGVVVRLCDKFRRLKNYARKGTFAVKDEGFEDTGVDIINYTAMMIELHRQEKAKARVNTWDADGVDHNHFAKPMVGASNGGEVQFDVVHLRNGFLGPIVMRDPVLDQT